MDATFHFRRKIGCALAFHPSVFTNALEEALTRHPWFFLTSQNEAQIVWSDRLIPPSSFQQRIVYVGFVEGAKMNSFEHLEQPVALPVAEKALYVPSASARALIALLKPIQDLGGIRAFQVTGLIPPDPLIPSMALFYQTIPAREEQFAQPLTKELIHLLGASEKLIKGSSITGLYASIRQGPFLTLTVQTERPLVLAELISQWRAPSKLPATPSSLSAELSPIQLISQEPFIVVQDGPEAPYLRMQRESCLIGQLCVDENQIRVCVVPPDPVISLLASTETLVMSGAIYW